MTAFKIRVQRKTVWPNGDESALNIPFARRAWEIFTDGEYYGFAMTFDQAVRVVNGIRAVQAIRSQGLGLKESAHSGTAADDFAQLKRWLTDQLVYATERSGAACPEALATDAVEYLANHEMLDLEQIEISRMLHGQETTC